MNSTDADNSLQNPVNTMEQTLLAYCRRQGLFRLGDRVIVACSGGADSMALLCFLLRCKAELGITVMAAHVDHGIRGETAHADGRCQRGADSPKPQRELGAQPALYLV